MQILYLTDLHIKISTFSLIDTLIQFLSDWFKTHVVSYIVIGGDTLDTHERICVHALNKACQLLQFLQQFGKIYILVGNHDYINNSQYLTNKHWLNILKEWPSIIVVDHVVYNDGILFVPYVPVGRFTEAVATAGPVTPRLIFAHQEFKGCQLGYILSTKGDIWTGPRVISGHIHKPHNIGANIIYPGASICHGTMSVSLGPCCVTPNGEINYLGFKTSQSPTVFTAPDFSPDEIPQNSKVILCGTKVDIAMCKGNPQFKPIFKNIKINLSPSSFHGFSWEDYIVKNLKTKIMKDDWEEISKFNL